MKQHIPNALTCGNLLCGCVGIAFALTQGDLAFAAILIGIAAVLDFLDGFLARLLRAYSPIGKELDSLADCVTFGVLPSVIIFQLMRKSLFDDADLLAYTVLPLAAFVIAVFSALRLAKFNVDPRQTDSFIGLPTPANALLIAALPFIQLQYPAANEFLLNYYGLLAFSGLMSLLLVAEIPLLALKFRGFSFAENKVRYVFLLIAAVLLLALQSIAVPIVIALYVILSIITKPRIA